MGLLPRGKRLSFFSNYMRKFIQKVAEVVRASHRRNGLWKQVREAKEGCLELRRVCVQRRFERACSGAGCGGW